VELLIQCHLVEKGGRPGYLFQTVDIGDYHGVSIPTLTRFIKRRFPTLKTHKDSQGIYITRTDIRTTDVDTNAKAGRILGYQCADRFDGLDRSKTTYTYHMWVRLKNKSRVHLYSFVCPSSNKKKQWKQDGELIEKLLVGNKDLPLFRGKPIQVVSVEMEMEKELPPSYFLTLLLQTNRSIPQDAIDKMETIWFNIGFDTNTRKRLRKEFDPQNPLHRGIMASLLCFSIHNPLEPFFPIQYTGKQDQVQAQLDQFGKLLVRSLRESRKHPTDL
jgi:hypothetical protein